MLAKAHHQYKTIKLILGDQLNEYHSWFNEVNDSVLFVMMEVQSESSYVTHHIQKVLGFFAAMRDFSNLLQEKGHHVAYIKINATNNLQTFPANLNQLFAENQVELFEYQEPDEYRLDQLLKEFCASLSIPFKMVSSEHFLSERDFLADFFKGKKTYLMESFYRQMRKNHSILMEGANPVGGKWNFDADNRKKIPVNHFVTSPLLFANDTSEIEKELQKAEVKTIGNVDSKNFLWPINRLQSLELLTFFVEHCLPLFGTFQDAMQQNQWSIYHSRLSFSINTKMLSPREVIDAAIQAWEKNPKEISLNQLEGFVRQILGWREYMRGIYWAKMPEYATLNFFENSAPLPEWFWTGKTKMNCLSQAINQSLDFAYAHHIQRLMITGNFALLAGVHPDEIDAWYLGIYIDALDWVEITNTRGMSQFADGGIVGTKPYVSSASYIDKMSNYCSNCYYKKELKTGEKACPFNSLYWNFYDRNEAKLASNPRIGMMYNVWRKMEQSQKTALLNQAEIYLNKINEL
ncbi:MAG: cryptochrome/photolyase family protein [Flavobacteriales bacterium]|nr:cryptochrome/photolyase family protein [Flavobacteriales bacterium]